MDIAVMHHPPVFRKLHTGYLAEARIVQKLQSIETTIKLQNAEKIDDIIKIEPRFMGVAFNFNALFRRFKQRAGG